MILNMTKKVPSPNTKLQSDLLALAEQLVNNPDAPFSLRDTTERFGVSESQVQRRFVKAFGVSPKALQTAARMGKFKSALRAGQSVLTAIVDAGFGSTSRLYGEPERNLGMTPSSYARGAAGEQIFWTCGDTKLGSLLLAATERGICFAQFGERAEILLQQLSAEFPSAVLTESHAKNSKELHHWWLAIEQHLSNQQPIPDLPLDLRGTAFQIKVWRFLQRMRSGTTISYGALAANIDHPKAVRAAASACAANRIAILVPCHRVLRGDGEIGGYRWGVERKRRLLEMESVQAL
jgi:AraC family transcriptional regulator, regulatory protein of adaptative response / methylated-DNA-[protein]-cysteine methyltransferase